MKTTPLGIPIPAPELMEHIFEAKQSADAPPTPDQILKVAGETFAQRSKVYGDNYLHFGVAMTGLFPRGFNCVTEGDWVRMGLLVQCVSKLSRYAQNMCRGGHSDSAHDLSVYAAMLESVTDER